MCIYGNIATGVETLRTRVKYNMERGASEFCSDWTLADNGNLQHSGRYENGLMEGV